VASQSPVGLGLGDAPSATSKRHSARNVAFATHVPAITKGTKPSTARVVGAPMYGVSRHRAPRGPGWSTGELVGDHPTALWARGQRPLGWVGGSEGGTLRVGRNSGCSAATLTRSPSWRISSGSPATSR